MSSPKVLLLLGAGANIGASVARTFAANGYKVALASRTSRNHDAANLHVQADLSDPSSLVSVFQKVERELGTPSVVVYNGELRILDDKHAMWDEKH
jgi:NAD(P)-dependent dehydrogenase (short-subunit alcohol dehydrogenase family)